MTMLACTICTTTVALVAGSAGAVALLLKIYWARLRHLFRPRQDRCDCGCHKHHD